MSYEEISSGHVHGRKVYLCEWCGEIIEKGEKHLSRVYRWEGDFNKGRMHLACEEAMDKSPWDLVSEGWMPGEQKRGEVLS